MGKAKSSERYSRDVSINASSAEERLLVQLVTSQANAVWSRHAALSRHASCMLVASIALSIAALIALPAVWFLAPPVWVQSAILGMSPSMRLPLRKGSSFSL